eukprot:14783_1
MFTVSICTYLILSTIDAAYYQQLITDDGPTTSQRYGRGTCIVNDTAFIGAYNDDGGDGCVYVFQYNYSLDSWTQKQKLTPSDFSGGRFGLSLDYDPVNKDLIIGSYFHNSSRGAAYLFNQNVSNGLWEETQILIPSNAATSDYCGHDVSVENNVAVLGCDYDDDTGSQNGAIRIFKKELDTSWTEVIKITADDHTANLDWFGYAVDISYGTIVVGSYGWGSTNQGAVYIIEKDITWNITQRLFPLDPIDYAFFGVSVSIVGDKLAIGASGYNNNTGKVYIYDYNGTIWSQTTTITRSDSFGHSLALYNNTLAVGSNLEIYVFELNTNWTESAKLTPNVSSATNIGGKDTVSVWEDIILVGAYRDSTGGSDAGSAHVYDLTTINPTTNPTINPTRLPTTYPTPKQTISLNINHQTIGLLLEIEYYTTKRINETHTFYDLVVLNKTKFTNIIQNIISDHYDDMVENDIVLIFGDIAIISSSTQSITIEIIHNITNYNPEISDLLSYCNSTEFKTNLSEDLNAVYYSDSATNSVLVTTSETNQYSSFLPAPFDLKLILKINNAFTMILLSITALLIFIILFGIIHKKCPLHLNTICKLNITDKFSVLRVLSFLFQTICSML